MTRYDKPAQFPSPYIPQGLGVEIPDAFGNLLKTGAGLTLGTPGPAGPPGGVSLDLNIYNGRTGALIYDGPDSLDANGVPIFWIQIDTNNNGTDGFMLVLGSLPYTTSLG